MKMAAALLPAVDVVLLQLRPLKASLVGYLIVANGLSTWDQLLPYCRLAGMHLTIGTSANTNFSSCLWAGFKRSSACGHALSLRSGPAAGGVVETLIEVDWQGLPINQPLLEPYIRQVAGSSVRNWVYCYGVCPISAWLAIPLLSLIKS